MSEQSLVLGRFGQSEEDEAKAKEKETKKMSLENGIILRSLYQNENDLSVSKKLGQAIVNERQTDV